MAARDFRLTSQTTTIILVRHAESTWNAVGRWQGQADPPLSEHGRAQARLVAQRLSSEPLSALYSSDLRRALETATIVAQPQQVQPRPDSRLRELDVGAWTGLTREEMQEQHPEQFLAWREQREDARAGGGETCREMQQRAAAALEEIVDQHAGETVGIVTHGGVIYALRGHVLGLSLDETFKGLPPNRNTAITVMHCQDGQGEVALLMDASHLDEVGDDGGDDLR